MELVCRMQISLELCYIRQNEYDELVKQTKNLTVKMSSFIKVLANN